METNNQTIRATASATAGLILVETSRPLSREEFSQIRAAGFSWQVDVRAFVAPLTAETFATAGRLAGRVDVENSGGQWHAGGGNEAARALQASGESYADMLRRRKTPYISTMVFPDEMEPETDTPSEATPSGEGKTAPAPSGGALPTIERDAINVLGDFIGRSQLAAIVDAMRGEEGECFGGMVADLAQRIDAMPQTYQQDGMGDAAIVGLHYFNSGSDWYITEKDADGGTAQAFGYAVLNGWEDCADLGYISIADLVAHGAELDLYWQPRTLGEVKAERGGGDGVPDGAGTVPPSGECSTKIQTVELRDRTGRAWLALAGVPKGCDSLHALTYGAAGVAHARAAKLRACGISAAVRGDGPHMIEINPPAELADEPCPTLLPGRWIPGGTENAERIAFDAALGAEVWLIASSAQPGALAVIAYAGKRTKHDAHYTMLDRGRALQWAGEYMGKQQATAQRKADRSAEKAAKRAAGHKLKAGDVLRCSWGYDQTNIDYYEVTRLIGARMVEIRSIGAESVESGGMTGECVPRPGHYIGEPMRKVVSDYDGQSVRIASYASAHKIEPREVGGVKVYPVDRWTAYA